MNVDQKACLFSEHFEKEPWPKELYGQFFGGDSFLVLYTYIPRGRASEEYIIYIWQGRESSQDEKGASALQAVALDDEHGGTQTTFPQASQHCLPARLDRFDRFRS